MPRSPSDRSCRRRAPGASGWPCPENTSFSSATRTPTISSGTISQGFPLAGQIPVSPVAPLHEVRVPSIRTDELEERAGQIAESLLAQHSAAPRGPEADKKVFSQTLGDVRLGRMGPLGTPGVDLFPPYTQRFGVSQKSSHGEVKVRCIDDFAQSLINDTVRINRRIRMGSIADFVETARRLHAARPEEALHVTGPRHEE